MKDFYFSLNKNEIYIKKPNVPDVIQKFDVFVYIQKNSRKIGVLKNKFYK